MQLTPVQSLVLLLLLGLAVSGWLYGIHWKRVASGITFTKEETIMIQLQDQIEVLSQKNASLNQAIRELQGETNPEPAVPASSDTDDAVVLPSKD